jgi:manganese/iron transport system permease protein/iron/zinc/copper transport system permease protein
MVYPISSLREGRTAKIVEAGKEALFLNLHPGELVTIGPRKAEDTLWTMKLRDGSEILLDHQTADSILVKAIN